MSLRFNIPFHKPTFLKENLIGIEHAFSTGGWCKESSEAKDFFSNYFSGKPVFFTNSCSSALEIALKALHLQAEDEVIIPAFGYVAVANAVVNNGARPVFADVHLNGNIDVQSFESAITPNTRAVIAIHYGGNAVDVDSLSVICRSNNLFFIEDAAQSIGAAYYGKPAGSFGHLSCLSFDYMKNVSCGQGGLLIVNDTALLEKVQTIYDNGTNRTALINGTQKYFEWVGKGGNYTINPIAGHFLGSQLKDLELITHDRLAKWNLYFELLQPLLQTGKIGLPDVSAGHNGHIFYLIASTADERDKLRTFLRENGIFSEHHYSSLANSAFGKQFASGNENVKNAEILCHRLLRLPLWYQLPEGDVRNVVSVLNDFYSS